MGVKIGLSHSKGRTKVVGVFENREVRSIFVYERVVIRGRLRNFHNRELRNIYSPLNVIRVSKSGRIRWAEL
jgi:hypothetical protein